MTHCVINNNNFGSFCQHTHTLLLFMHGMLKNLDYLLKFIHRSFNYKCKGSILTHSINEFEFPPFTTLQCRNQEKKLGWPLKYNDNI
jgi:hypothetical protein